MRCHSIPTANLDLGGGSKKNLVKLSFCIIIYESPESLILYYEPKVLGVKLTPRICIHLRLVCRTTMYYYANDNYKCRSNVCA